MPRKQHNIHYIYKTTCTVTGRYYIGMHSTSNLNDGYLGSGKQLRYSIRKHGKENHVREILEYCDSRENLREAEKKAVTIQILNDNNCLNLCLGGEGGATMTGRKWTTEQRDKFILARTGHEVSQETKDKISKKVSEGLIGNKRAVGSKGWVGKKHRKGSVELMKENNPFRKIIEMYNLSGELLATFDSLHEAEEKTGNLRKHISRCCRGLAKTCGKHIWKFKN